MLVLKRKVGERILIKNCKTGDAVIVSYESSRSDSSQVRFGFTDNGHCYTIVREEADQELFDQEMEKQRLIKAGYSVSKTDKGNSREDKQG